MTIVKSKSCKSDRRLGYYTLNYTEGIDVVFDTVTIALQYGLIRKAGAWYYLPREDGEEDGFQGVTKLLNHLRANEEELEKLIHEVEAKME